MLYADRAVAYSKQGEYAKALPDISRVLTDVRPMSNGLPAVSVLDVSSGEYAFVFESSHVEWRLLRADALLHLDRAEDAISDLKIALKLDRENEHALRMVKIAEGGMKGY